MGDHHITINGWSHRLERVPDWVRKVDVAAYEPRYISIGPIHRGKYDNPLRRQDLKKDCVWRLIKEPYKQFPEFGLQEKSIEDCRRALRPEVDKTRRFYAENFDDIDEYDWVEMLLQDGCFIIMHLLEFSYGIKAQHTYWVSNVLKIDLILLENQLPFFILERIMEFVFTDRVEGNDTSSVLKQFVVHFWGFRVDENDVERFENLLEGIKSKYIHHLVDLIHLAHCKAIYGENETSNNNKDCWQAILYRHIGTCIRKMRNAMDYTPILLMKLFSWPCEFCRKLLKKLEENEEQDEEEEDENIPTASVVHSLGIRFNKKSRSGIQSKYAVCINARNDYAMDIPQLEVSSTEAPLLYNLIAWEQTFTYNDDVNDYCNKGHFTKYAFLMYNLINSGDDIALLQEKGILLNKFGTDSQVVTYFKNLVLYNARRTIKTTYTSPDAENDDQRRKKVNSETREIDEIMDLLKQRVQKAEYRYWAEVKKKFSTPMQFVLVITSFVLFVSSLVQTISSTHQIK